MVERNYNLIELGPWGTGKSFVYRETSQIAMFISGATGPRSIPVLWEHVTSSTAGTPRWFSHWEAYRITSRAGFLWLSLETSDHQEISNRAEQFVSIEQAMDLTLRQLRRADEAAELARRKPEARYFYYRCGTQWGSGECTHKKLYRAEIPSARYGRSSAFSSAAPSASAPTSRG
jgi:hypothetical protein